MDPQKKKMIVAACLMMGMVLLIMRQYKSGFVTDESGGGDTPAAATSAAGTESAADETSAVAAEPVEIDRDKILAALNTDAFIYNYTNLRDPMVPVIYARDAEETGLDGETVAVSRAHLLDGIVWDPYEPLASINNTVVGIGDALADGSVVTSISRDEVTLTSDSGTFRVGFYEE